MVSYQKKPALRPSMRASTALFEVLNPCLQDVSSAAKRFERARGVKAVHKLRVALRRAHTALAVSHNLGSAESPRHMGAEIHRFQRRIGVVREWDVFIAGALHEDADESGKHRLRSVIKKASRRRRKAVKRSAADFGGKRFRKLMRHLVAFTAHLRNSKDRGGSDAERTTTRDPGEDPPLSMFAGIVLAKYYNRVEHEQRKARNLDSSHLHALRIRVKKLRYVAEFFQELYAAGPMKRFVSALTKFQDQLGEVHDFDIAQSKLSCLGGNGKKVAAAGFKGDINSLAKLTAAEKVVRSAAGAIGIKHNRAVGSGGMVTRA